MTAPAVIDGTRHTTLQMTESTPLPTANPAVIFKALAEGAVVFSTTTEEYFGLNAVGAKLWELLPTAGTTEALVAQLCELYPDAPADVIRADVGELIADLLAAGLVVARSAGEVAGR